MLLFMLNPQFHNRSQVRDVLRRQQEIGAVSGVDVAAQEMAAATLEAMLPGLEKQLAVEQDLLRMLAGQTSDEPLPARCEFQDLKLPDTVPVSLPSELVNQRPDIRAAEALLHAATANVGVARSQWFPQITLTANAGGASSQLSQLTAAGNQFWSAGALLSQVLFSGGAVKHRVRAAEASLDQAGAQYRSVVLQAFQNVADSLYALNYDAQTQSAQQRASVAAADVLRIARRAVENGSGSGGALLSAEQTLDQAELATIQARAQRLADTVALYQALGGGGVAH